METFVGKTSNLCRCDSFDVRHFLQATREETRGGSSSGSPRGLTEKRILIVNPYPADACLDQRPGRKAVWPQFLTDREEPNPSRLRQAVAAQIFFPTRVDGERLMWESIEFLFQTQSNPDPEAGLRSTPFLAAGQIPSPTIAGSHAESLEFPWVAGQGQ